MIEVIKLTIQLAVLWSFLMFSFRNATATALLVLGVGALSLPAAQAQQVGTPQARAVYPFSPFIDGPPSGFVTLTRAEFNSACLTNKGGTCAIGTMGTKNGVPQQMPKKLREALLKRGTKIEGVIYFKKGTYKDLTQYWKRQRLRNQRLQNQP
jgi:hypothetical protein